MSRQELTPMSEEETSRDYSFENGPINTPARPYHVSSTSQAISTGIIRLDAALELPSVVDQPISPLAARWSQRNGQPRKEATSSAVPEVGAPSGGIRRGEISEITGPKGVGKSTFAMAVAANTLLAGEKVVWIDTAGPVCVSRFTDILRSQIRHKKGPINSSRANKKIIRNLVDDALSRLLHFHAGSLAHLMALISSPPPGFPPQGTGLIVIDNISTLFNSEFKSELPLTRHRAPPPNSTRRQHHPTLAERQDRLRWKLIASILSSLRKLAARLDSGVLAINEMGSRFRQGQRPMLHQALSGITWERGVAARIVLYFAWLPPRMRESLGGMRRVRIAEVLKAAGRGYAVRSAERVVPFLLLRHGIRDLPDKTRLQIRLLQPHQRNTISKRLLKRKPPATHPLSSPIRRKLQTDTSHTSNASRPDDGPASTGTDEQRDDGLEEDALLLLDHLAEGEEEFT